MRVHATLALVLGTSLVAIPFLSVHADPIIDTCLPTGCATVFSTLAPCGGGATNSSLQQNYIYTPTESLGGCECNSIFYNAFSSCLSCIASQGENSPEIQNQQDWVANCESYGFNFTAAPVTNSTSSGNGDNDNNSSSGGLSTGAIVGIAIGAVVLIALIGGCFFLKSRKGKKEKTEQYDDQPTAAYGDGSGHAGAATAATAAAAAAGAAAVGSHDYDNSDYSNAYGQQQGQDGYYTNQHAGGYDSNYVDQGDYHNSYYGAPGQNQQDMMHNVNTTESYVPPPRIDTNIRPASPTAAAAAALAASPRPSDTFPQSLRSKAVGWGNSNSRQQELTSGLIVDPTQRNDKHEFDDGEQLEQPRDRYGFDRDNYSPRGSMTPPRVNMQSYRDDFNRPSFEREPRRSGSDRGSVTGVNMVRGTPGGLYENHNGSSGNGITDYDSQGDELQSPELARRRARAAELFSAEGTRR